MRWAVRIAVALLVLGVAGLVALAVALPRLAESEQVRARVQQAAREATGQELRWEALSFGLLPPRLVVRGAALSDPARRTQPSLAAETVDLRVALLPLLARTVLIDSLVVEGVRLHAVRTPRGLELPAKLPPRAKEPAAPKKEASAEAEERTGFALAVRELELRRAHLELEDRTLDPPLRFELRNLRAEARGRDRTSPVDVQLSGELGSGGSLEVSGSARLDGTVHLEVRLQEVELAPLARYLSGGRRTAGRLSGTLHVRGPATAPDSLTAELALRGADLAVNAASASGRLRLQLALEGGLEDAEGRFEVDASDAALAWEEVFRKPVGTRAAADGKIARLRDGTLRIEDAHLQLRNLDARTSLRLGGRSEIELEAAPFSVQGWGELIPALAPLAPSGEVAFSGWKVRTPPLELAGRMPVHALRITPEGREPLTLDGEWVGRGDGLHAPELRVVVAEQVVTLDATLSGLASEPRYRTRAAASEVDANALLSALTSLRDTLYGPLSFSADVGGPLAGGPDALRALTGSARLEIGKGRLKGVSLLRGTFDRLGQLGEAALVAGALRGGSTLQRFYGDEFESITGSFELAGGFARTQDLRLVYRHYVVDLRGALGLLDRSLDFAGTLTIEEEVDAALAGSAPPEAPTAGEAAPAPSPDAPSSPPATREPRRRVIPLARVHGTLDAPRVDLTREAMLALVRGYAASEKRQKLEQRIDEALGEGAGKQVLDALEGILGGRRESR